MTQPSKRRFHAKLKLIFISGLIAVALAVAKHLEIRELLQTSLIWVESLGVLGVILFIVIYNLGTLLFVPGSILTMKGGCLFGVFWGSVYVLIAAILGALWAFLLGRYLSRDWVCRYFPLIFGVTQISVKDYILGSVGMIPGTVMYVYIGSFARDLSTIGTPNQPTTSETEIAQWIIRIIGLLATVIATCYVTQLTKKALERSIL